MRFYITWPNGLRQELTPLYGIQSYLLLNPTHKITTTGGAVWEIELDDDIAAAISSKV